MDINPTMMEVLRSFAVSVKVSQASVYFQSDIGSPDSNYRMSREIINNLITQAHSPVFRPMVSAFVYDLIHTFHPDSDKPDELYEVYMNAYIDFYSRIE